ncbi:MAG: caspase family protein [Pseudomonadota bacterium]
MPPQTKKKPTAIKKKDPATLPITWVAKRVVAFVVGVENYREKTGGLPSVPYARDDAGAFAELLGKIYPAPSLRIEVMLDRDATHASLKYALLETIRGLQPEDLFIFYYAGHGYHCAGGNRITLWDTHAHHISDTTLLLRDILLDPLAKSSCEHALAFIDACASGFEDVIGSRDVFSSMDKRELEEFLSSARYSALFLSCEPGQKSYSSPTLHHGIWTHFLIEALSGVADDAITSSDHVTDTSLRDYLARAIPQFITQHTQIRDTQNPIAMINATNSFAIRTVPEEQAGVGPEGDFSTIAPKIQREYLERTEHNWVKSLPSFNKKIHFEPDNHGQGARAFILGLLEPKVDDEIQALYEKTKAQFGLRRRDVRTTSGGGQASLDTPYFRFTIESQQNSEDPSGFLLVRRLELRTSAPQHIAQMDKLFGPMFESTVVQFDHVAVDFEALVEFFEDMADDYGGDVKDEEQKDRVTFTNTDGISICVDFDSHCLTVSWRGWQSVGDILEVMSGFRFGPSGPSHLLCG